MTIETKRTTIYLDPLIHKALRLKSIETSRSLSQIVNQTLRESLSEDAEDLAAFDDRSDEPLIGYEEMIKRLKKNGRL